MKQVLIIEDHPLVAEATADLLKTRCSQLVVTVACDAVRAVEALDGCTDWHRVFLDLDVPGAFGLSLARNIAARGMAGRCCVISALQRTDVIQEARFMGFLGYIVKSVAVEEFARHLNCILVGESSYPASEVSNRPSACLLTKRQVQLLNLASDGLSSKQISRVVGITEGTINNHFNATLRALSVTNRTHAVARGIELGLIAARGSAASYSAPDGQVDRPGQGGE